MIHKKELTRNELIIAHDYLIQMGGAERVVALMAKHFPDAPIYTSRTDYVGLLDTFRGSKIVNSWMQRIPIRSFNFKKLFPLYPFAFMFMRPEPSSAAWISASTFAKCINLDPSTVSFCYCHAPTRFLWQPDVYINSEVTNPLARIVVRFLLPFLRLLDRRAALRMDYIIANSKNIQKQILKVYGREADVIYPPVDTARFQVSREDKGYYLILARLIRYKGIDRAIRAFANLDRELRIVGDGTDRARLESMATANVKFLGHITDQEVLDQMASCRALIFPGEEDFGITPVEAHACGKPVLAYGKGGALETVIHGKTGIHFTHPTSDSLLAGLHKLEESSWNVDVIRKQADRFSEKRFIEEMSTYMGRRLK